MISVLIKIANELDAQGLYTEASFLDSLLLKIAAQDWQEIRFDIKGFMGLDTILTLDPSGKAFNEINNSALKAEAKRRYPTLYRALESGNAKIKDEGQFFYLKIEDTIYKAAKDKVLSYKIASGNEQDMLKQVGAEIVAPSELETSSEKESSKNLQIGPPSYKTTPQVSSGLTQAPSQGKKIQQTPNIAGEANITSSEVLGLASIAEKIRPAKIYRKNFFIETYPDVEDIDEVNNYRGPIMGYEMIKKIRRFIESR